MSENIYIEPSNLDYIIIKTKDEVIAERGSLYEATRKAWHAKRSTAEPYKYALSVVQGVVREVYEVEKWQMSGDSDRIEFIGHVAPRHIVGWFKGRRIPEKYRVKGLASPFLYKKLVAGEKTIKVGEDTVSIAGNKLVENLMKEFNAAFPYLQLCIFPLSMKNESTKTPVDRKITIAQARIQAPSESKDFSLDGSSLVKDVEAEFISSHGLYVEICYYNKEGKGYYTSGSYDNMSLTELNKEIEKTGGIKDKWY